MSEGRRGSLEKRTTSGARTLQYRLFSVVERVLSRLLDVTVRRGKWVDVTELEISMICTEVSFLFGDEMPCIMLSMEVDKMVVVVGDLHGHYIDLMRIFDRYGLPGNVTYIFLGNYISHGPQSIEILLILFCYKILNPSTLYILRGNHENKFISKSYKFFDDLMVRFTARTWRALVSVFEMMPLAVVVEGKVFCCHSGISPELMLDRLSGWKKLVEHMSQTIVRPNDGLTEGLACDLMWAEPDYEVNRWAINECGCSFLFSHEILREFIEKYGFDLVVRSNRCVLNGYEFFDERRLLTIFSAVNFAKDFHNNAAVLELKRNLTRHKNTIDARIITFDKDLNARIKKKRE